jgi:hypothetical protein
MGKLTKASNSPILRMIVRGFALASVRMRWGRAHRDPLLGGTEGQQAAATAIFAKRLPGSVEISEARKTLATPENQEAGDCKALTLWMNG